MNDSPIAVLVSVLVAGYLLKLWIDDLRAFRRGTPNPRALPGATPVELWVIGLSVLMSLLLVVLETAGEIVLDVSSEQSTVPWYFLFAMISAGIVEEVLFRGFAVITRRGKAALVAGIVLFSVVFALLHAHLLGGGDAEAASDSTRNFLGLEIDLGPAALWWTFILFLNSLWWYTVRFMPGNPQRSLLPCFAGHIASNLGVFGVKLAQGFVAL